MYKTIKIITSLVLLLTIFTLGNLKSDASSVDLSKEQKIDYYKQYEEIVNEINSQEPNSTLELGSFEGFTSEDFIEPSKFKEYAIQRSNVQFTLISDSNAGITPFSVTYASKQKSVKSNDLNITVTINGSFHTQYSSIHKRQLFNGVQSITTNISKGTWTKSTSDGYSARLLDGGRTYEIIVSGKITINNISSSHHISLEFYCNTNGSVS